MILVAVSYLLEIDRPHFNDPANGQRPYQLWDAFVKLETPSKHFGIQGFVKNIGNKSRVPGTAVYVTSRADWAPMNEIYFANFTRDPPHRVSCIVAGLGSPECLVEIDATVYLGDDRRAD